MLEKILEKFKPKAGQLILVARRDDKWNYLDLGERNSFDLTRRRNEYAVREVARSRISEVYSRREYLEAMPMQDFVNNGVVYEVVQFEFWDPQQQHRAEFDVQLHKSKLSWKSIETHPQYQHINLP